MFAIRLSGYPGYQGKSHPHEHNNEVLEVDSFSDKKTAPQTQAILTIRRILLVIATGT